MDFEVSGENYRSGKLTAKQQFHLARRLTPILSSLQGASDDDAVFQSIVSGIADMPDETCDYILDTCLSVVQRQQGSGFVKVYNDRAKSFQFDDIDMQKMLEIARHVIEENLGGFFGGSNATGDPSQAKTA